MTHDVVRYLFPMVVSVMLSIAQKTNAEDQLVFVSAFASGSDDEVEDDKLDSVLFSETVDQNRSDSADSLWSELSVTGSLRLSIG